MEDLLNQVRRAAREAVRDRAPTRHGTISSYDPNTHGVRVELQPDGTLTGWLPLKAVWIGNGWGMFAAPSIGDAVEVDFQEADGGVGSVGHRFFNDEDRPLSVPSGEFWLVHQSGAFLKLTNDGAITLSDGQGATLSMKGGVITSTASSWNHSGPITVTNGDIKADGISLKTHKHGGVQAGSAITGLPQ